MLFFIEKQNTWHNKQPVQRLILLDIEVFTVDKYKTMTVHIYCSPLSKHNPLIICLPCINSSEIQNLLCYLI